MDIEAKIAAILDATTVAINKGAADGVKSGTCLKTPTRPAQPILDPDTHERLDDDAEETRGTGFEVIAVHGRWSKASGDDQRDPSRVVDYGWSVGSVVFVTVDAENGR